MKGIKLIILFQFIFLFGCQNERSNIIAIQPYEDFPETITDTLASMLQEKLKTKVYVLSPKPLPKDAFINVKSPRYRADKIIRILKKEKPDSVDYIIGLTRSDISTSKKNRNGKIKEPRSKYEDWGVFGLGFRPGPSCIVSNYRLKHQNQATYRDRLKKVALHEVGHNIGLKHCPSDKCVMRDAVETIRTIDNVDLDFCPDCQKRVSKKFKG